MTFTLDVNTCEYVMSRGKRNLADVIMARDLKTERRVWILRVDLFQARVLKSRGLSLGRDSKHEKDLTHVCHLKVEGTR